MLGPFLDRTPTEGGFREFCNRLKIQRWSHMRWAWMQSPVVTPSRERELVDFCVSVFQKAGRLIYPDRNFVPRTSVVGAGRYDFAYPPLRLADDFPLHIYGVFVDRTEIKPGEAEGREDNCHIEYLERGTCTVRLNGKWRTLSQGQMILFLPGDRVGMEPVHGSSSAIAVSFVAVGSILAEIAGIPHALDSFQFSLFSRIVDIAASAGDAAHRNSELKILLANLLLSFRKSSHPAQSVKLSPTTLELNGRGTTVLEIRRYLDETSAERPRLSAVARHFHMSVPSLRRIFKSQTGLSPMEWRRKQVITQAKLLLCQRRTSVTEVSRRLGYSSINYFSHDFKKVTGVCPRDYARTSHGIDRQIEEAQMLLEHKNLPIADIADRLGFDTPHSFAQYFRHHVGLSPKKYRKTRGMNRGGDSGEKKPSQAGKESQS